MIITWFAAESEISFQRRLVGRFVARPATLRRLSRKASELNPDLILLDISMPDGSGLNAARRIRQKIPQVKILMMSHHDATQFERSAIESGADGCIDKARLALDLVAMIKSLQPNGTTPAGPKFR